MFGDVITMVHANVNALVHNGMGGERELLVDHDLATGCMGTLPVATMSAERILLRPRAGVLAGSQTTTRAGCASLYHHSGCSAD